MSEILIKSIKTPSLNELSKRLDKAQEWAKSVGLQEEDIKDAIKTVRQNKKG